MYLRTQRASAWLDADTPTTTTPPEVHQAPPQAARPSAQIVEARKPFDGRLGRYLAVKHLPDHAGQRGTLLVAIANTASSEKGPRWVRADLALTSREAARWAREGF